MLKIFRTCSLQNRLQYVFKYVRQQYLNDRLNGIDMFADVVLQLVARIRQMTVRI